MWYDLVGGSPLTLPAVLLHGAEKMADLTTRGLGDEDFESIDSLLSLHLRTILKAPLIGLMVLFSLYVITESTSKSLLVGFICFCISLFRTWRRFLEPLSFVLFCLAVVVLCDQEMIVQLKGIALAWAELTGR